MNERDANGGSARIRTGGFVGRWDRVSQWLVYRAARATPPALVARLEEEWLADLATRPSVFSRLRFALGCCWATMVIAHELRAAVPVTSTASGPNFLGDAGYFSRRSLTLLLVVALHVALFFALMNGLVTNVHKIIEQPIVPRFIDHAPPTDLPPPPRPALEKWRMIDIPPPENPPVGSLRRPCRRQSERSEHTVAGPDTALTSSGRHSRTWRTWKWISKHR